MNKSDDKHRAGTGYPVSERTTTKVQRSERVISVRRVYP